MPLLAYDRNHYNRCLLDDESLSDMILLLKDWKLAVAETCHLLSYVENVSINSDDYQDGLLPFNPISYRDFMLYEQHVINAAKGFIREFIPKYKRMIDIYERIFRKTLPKVKPKDVWYKKPIYYTGNHLSFRPDNSEIEWPTYSNYIDYELELGMLITKPLYNATKEEAQDAIGGFVMFNDCSARDMQYPEMESGFGPVKSKNFASVLAQVVGTPDEIWSNFDSIETRVYINDVLSGTGRLASPYHSFEEAVSYASLGEHIYPGEFMGTGTIAGCSGIESNHHVKFGDVIRMECDHLGVLATTIAKRK
jgi:2-keto-4-pentenoate hydratase/2-oxohepta-3-ene-1,7-dioic acid hydratase in catechol pathway